MTEVKVTGDEVIGDLVQQHPKVAGVMLKYGLHCVGCHVNQFETVKQGVLGHGMPEETLNEMLQEINLVLNKKIETLEVTPAALEMIRNYSREDGKEGQGLRITVQKSCCGLGYDMEFVKTPEEGDEVFSFDDVQVFVTKESYPLLKGSEIDFVETLTEAGFRIDNPNSPKKEGGCCGGSGEGCGCKS